MLLSILGIAVGTGNIWRFPRIAAESSGPEGAGAFLLAWILFLAIWSIPLIIAEYALGRHGRKGVIGSFIKTAGKRYAWMGAFVGLVATFIMFYYSVVTGWAFFYFIEAAFQPLPTSLDGAQAVWEGLQAGWLPVAFHALAMGLGAAVVWKGISSVERVSKVLLPSLVGIIMLAVIRILTLDGAWEGIAFMFTPSWETLGNPRIWVAAITQNAWDTGAGWGLILTYAAYMQLRHGVVRNACITGIANNTISLLSGMLIFGIVFAVLGAEMSQPEALAVMRESGPASTGLTFIWLPQLFEAMPLGRPLAILFFLGLSFAAFTSLVSMIELVSRSCVDAGLARPRAVGVVALVGFIMGLPSAFSVEILANQDFVWGIALMISGVLIAAAVIKYGTRSFREDVVDSLPGDWKAGRAWEFLISRLVPLQAVLLIGWWLYQAAFVYAPDSWYNPFAQFSIMSCLVQWGVILVAVLVLNRWIARQMTPQGA